MVNPPQFALGSIICSSVPLPLLQTAPSLSNGPGGDKRAEWSCIASGGLPAPFQTEKARFIGMEEIRDHLQTPQLPRFWKTFQQVWLQKGLPKHPAFSAVVILFSP